MTDHFLELAYKIRIFERKVLKLAGTKSIKGTTHTCIGQELIPVVLMNYAKNNDFVISNHRSHGHFLAKTKKFKELACELMGLSNGINHGVGGSQHLKDDYYISSGVQGSLLPMSLGIASYNQSTSTDNIVIIYLGDGTFGEGVLYEVLNWASLWNLPILFVIEDNHYAQSTKKEMALSGSIKGRCLAFDIQFYETNSFQLNELSKTCETAINFVRNNHKPAMLHVDTYRLSPHSKGDDLRDAAEIERFQKIDLVSLYENKLTEEKINRIDSEINQYFEVENTEIHPLITRQMTDFFESSSQQINIKNDQKFFSKKINIALEKCFEKYNDLILIGEDVEDPYGGAFKITKGLSQKFPNRIKNSPISESALIGFAAGRSFRGLKTIAEIMFGDFFTLAFDQFLNVISKKQSMYGELSSLPMMVRIPTGPNGAYGATHSQEVSQYFQNIPFINLKFVTAFSNVEEFYLNCFSDDQQMANVIFEPKRLYTFTWGKNELDILNNYNVEQIGKSGDAIINLSIDNPDITFLIHPFYSTEVIKILQISKRYEVGFELFIPENLRRIPVSKIKQSLVKTKKLFIWDSGFNLSGSFLDLIMELKKEVEFDFDYQVIKQASIPANENEEKLFYDFEHLLIKLRRLYEK